MPRRRCDADEIVSRLVEWTKEPDGVVARLIGRNSARDQLRDAQLHVQRDLLVDVVLEGAPAEHTEVEDASNARADHASRRGLGASGAVSRSVTVSA